MISQCRAALMSKSDCGRPTFYAISRGANDRVGAPRKYKSKPVLLVQNQTGADTKLSTDLIFD
jgi:hypothetical protein